MAKMQIALIADNNALVSHTPAEDASTIFYSDASFEWRLFSRTGQWLRGSSGAVVLEMGDIKAFRYCVESAWNCCIPCAAFWPDLELASMSQHELDELQDLVDKSDILIFTSEAQYSRFLNIGLSAPDYYILEKQPGVLPDSHAAGQPVCELISAAGMVYPDLEKVSVILSQRCNCIPVPVADQDIIYIDVTLIGQGNPTIGVSRCEFEFARHLYNLNGEKIRFVIFNREQKAFFTVKADCFLYFVDNTMEGRQCVIESHEKCRFLPNSKLLIINFNWRFRDYLECVSGLAFGLRIRVYHYFHDWYDSKFPYWLTCFPPDRRAHLALWTNCVSVYITQSLSTVRDLQEFLSSSYLPQKPCRNVKVGCDLSVQTSAATASIQTLMSDLGGKPYILMVASFYYHKQHSMIYKLFTRLLKNYNSEDVPHLVCVAYKGPDETTREMLLSDTVVNKHIHIVHSLTDAEVKYLYQNCLFSVFPSLYEGWGSPIGESVVNGKVCITSNTASMPEVAGNYADLLDPLDFSAWYQRFCHYIFHPEKLKAREEELNTYKPYTWQDAGNDLALVIRQEPARPGQAPLLSTGTMVRFEKQPLEACIGYFGPGTCWNRAGICIGGSGGRIQFRIRNRKDIAIDLELQVRGEFNSSILLKINGRLFSCLALSVGLYRITLLPSDASVREQGSFREVAIDLINPAYPLMDWDFPRNLTALILKKIGCRKAAKNEIERENALAVLDTFFMNGGAIFRGATSTRSDLANLIDADSNLSAIRLLLWGCSQGIYEDFGVARARKQLAAILQNLMNSVPPGSSLAEYTGMVHLAWLTDPDAPSSVGDSDRNEALIVEWFKQHYKDRLAGLIGQYGRSPVALANQTPPVRRNLDEFSKKGRKNKKSEHQSYAQLNQAAGFCAPDDFEYSDPVLGKSTSHAITMSQFHDPLYSELCVQLGEPCTVSRKQWAQVYILHALLKSGRIMRRARGLGFGCGADPLPATLANMDCSLLVTDHPDRKKNGENKDAQLTLQDIWRPGIITREKFEENVRTMQLDMNKIPARYNGRFDFVWSAYALEYLGSLDKSIEFIRNSIQCLKPGGIAVHVMQINISDLDDTLDTPDLSLLRKRDIEDLSDLPSCRLMQPNWGIGTSLEDLFVEFPASESSTAFKTSTGGFFMTSMGLIFRRI